MCWRGACGSSRLRLLRRSGISRDALEPAYLRASRLKPLLPAPPRRRVFVHCPASAFTASCRHDRVDARRTRPDRHPHGGQLRRLPQRRPAHRRRGHRCDQRSAQGAGHLRLGGLARAGRSAAAEAAGGVRPARPRDRGRAERAPAHQDRGLRRLAVHRGADRPAHWRPHRVRRDAHLPRPALPAHRAPRRPALLRAGAAQLRTLARSAGAGTSYGLYSVLDFIVDNLLPIVRHFREELQELEQDIFAASFNRDTVSRLYDMQRDLMTLRLAVAPLQDVISQLVRLHPQLIPDELRAYFRDVHDHVTRVNDAISAMREMLTAAINVNLSLVTFGQNEVMKKLAGWAAMLAAPTLITSWYGMNFTHMPELAESWSYPVIIGVVACVVGGIFLALKRAKWL